MPTVELSHHYKASPAQIFRAWSDPNILKNWFAPTEKMLTIVDALDFRVGGKFRIHMKDPNGEDHIAVGEYVEIIPDTKIVMTWKWEDATSDMGQEATLLTIALSPRDGGTDLTLTHEKLATPKSVEMHTQGWQGCLARLEKIM